MRAAVAAVIFGVPVWASAFAAPAFEEARIVDVEARLADGAAIVSYRLEGAFPDPVRERLHSGIDVRYEHRVQLVVERAWWANRAWELTAFETVATYDSLTRRYRLERRFADPGASAVGETRVTESLDEVVGFLTEVRGITLPVPEGALGDGPVALRVTCRLGRRWLLWMFPASWSVTATIELGR